MIPKDYNNKVSVGLLPLISRTSFNNSRPYGYGNGLMTPNVGGQQYLSGGIFGRYKFLQFQLQPEFAISQNRPYRGFGHSGDIGAIENRFYLWNRGDFPERYGDGMLTRFWWGQSKVTLQAGSVEAGISTQQIWWGPGQFNALTFSYNAPGFPHFTFNTSKPVKTFLGQFEGQFLIGRLSPSGLAPSQIDQLNATFYEPPVSDWRYLNAISLTYQPKWVTNLFLGFSRTFQQFDHMRGNSVVDWLPVFEGLIQPSKFARDGSYNNTKDQQVTVFGRYIFTKLMMEMYFEYGRRDHAFNFRDILLNPEHSRAYILGFNKLIPLPESDRHFQIRAEMTQQLETINYMARYGASGLFGWHQHSSARGFAHFGQALGVGVGDSGSNVQTMELSVVDTFNKYGIVLERLENHQTFFRRAFGDQDEVRPWVDLSFGLLLDRQWDQFLLSSRLQFINAFNYQWELHPSSSPELPRGKDLFSVYAKVDLVYFLR
ncbi:capsule assembly Wzi family protein [Litoribacter ruber]|uniref:capsule assembly Wzi family protein n=1 Tax=Litoribacter ruber TaxID=702568 RepID=UPI001FEBA358|nr:capsule assembly Wzi family protein [Litoribacter alkaliphilus]